MNKLQKQSWYQIVIAAAGSASALFLYLKNAPAIALGALGMTMALSKIDWSFKIFPDKKADSDLDEKAQKIVLAAYTGSLHLVWYYYALVLPAACWIFHKQDAVPIGWVIAIWLGGSIVWCVLYAVFILIQYRRGGKENE